MAKVWIFSLLSHSPRISLPALRERDLKGQKKWEQNVELGKWKRKKRAYFKACALTNYIHKNCLN
jgi:hypothetical protein